MMPSFSFNNNQIFVKNQFIFSSTFSQNQYFNAVPFFNYKKFSTFRFNLYGGGENARELINVNVTIHGQDITTILNHFKDEYKKIILVGHSLGCSAIMMSEYKLANFLVFWDPSFEFLEWEHKEIAFQPQLDKYMFFWGRDYLVSKELVREWQTFDLNLLEQITQPTKVIRAEKGVHLDNWIEHIKKIKTYHISTIKNADHCFYAEGTEQQLFLQTYDWISKFV